MKKYKWIMYSVPLLILCLTLSLWISKKTQYTSKNKSTQERVNTNNLTYYEIMKAPYYYQGENVNFRGEVIEISKKDNSTMIKLAVNNNLDDMFVVCGRDIEISNKVKENNIVNISGSFSGIIRYKGINNQQISFPGIWMNKLDIVK